MDALDVLKVCLRRWYVAIPVMVLALAAGFGFASQQRPVYTAFASYALVYHNPPGSSTLQKDPREANPLGGDGAILLGESLAADFMSAASQSALGGVGNSGVKPGDADLGTSYSVALPQYSQSYLVQTWGKDPAAAQAVVDAVLAAAPGRAAAIQDRAGAPTRSQYTTFVTSATQVSALPPTSRLKLVVAVLGVGALAGAALSLLVDRLARSRPVRTRRSKQARPVPAVAWWPLDQLAVDGALDAASPTAESPASSPPSPLLPTGVVPPAPSEVEAASSDGIGSPPAPPSEAVPPSEVVSPSTPPDGDGPGGDPPVEPDAKPAPSARIGLRDGGLRHGVTNGQVHLSTGPLANGHSPNTDLRAGQSGR